MLGMPLVFVKCKMLSQDRVTWEPNLVLTGKELGEVDTFS